MAKNIVNDIFPLNAVKMMHFNRLFFAFRFTLFFTALLTGIRIAL